MKRNFRLGLAVTMICALAIGCGKKEAGGSAAAGSATITAEAARRLALTDVSGFERTSENASGSTASPLYVAKEANAKGEKAAVQVSVGPCVACLPMKLEAYQAMRGDLMMMLSRAAKENPDLVFEIAEADFDGKKVIYTYYRSYVVQKSDSGTSRSATHGIMVFYNNGANQLTLQVSSRGGRMALSAEELAAKFTREEMLAAARTIFAAFVGGLGE